MSISAIVAYLAVAVFLVAVLTRFVKISRLPMHVRWELYPVAHEKGRAHYGGSYLEEPDWWTKKRQSSKLGELAVMVPEILLLSGVREHNPRHWFFTFPFHFGLYLLAGLVGLLLIGGIAGAAGADLTPAAGLFGAAIYHLTYVFGYLGLILALIGALALLARRTFNIDYREYTSPGDYFNLLFFVAAAGVALLHHLVADPSFVWLRLFFERLVTFDLALEGAALGPQPGLMAAEIILGALLLAYIPLTHMSHFFTKWFMYHDIRWGDEPNLRGGKMEKKIHEALNYPVSWSASHIRGDGKKTWAQVATEGVEENAE
jgi:nitrate reductase gamma subunit